MIKSLTITNHLNESITMELRFPEKSGFLILGIEGLGPSKADINITDVNTMDGAVYNSARVTSRNIVFSLAFIEKPTIEDTRQKSYKYFPTKKRIKIEIETDNRISYTYGYVESNEPNIFSKQEGCVISVICPDPYLYGSEDSITSFASLTPLFEFPFSNESTSAELIEFGSYSMQTSKDVYYEGDAEVGIVINIHAIGSANDVSITNVLTLDELSIDSAVLIALLGSDITAGDEIEISTVKGNKYAIITRDAVVTNIMNALGKYPDWLTLQKGDNIFAYAADTGITNLQFTIRNKIAYEGI